MEHFSLSKVIGARAEANLTQEDMAEALNISRNAYYKKEKGFIDFGVEQLTKLAKFTNKDVSYFFVNDVTESKQNVNKKVQKA
ncbi:helix-turn-helix transcriptional regulator [Apilactobacillus xinyiensis]|uniref:helix-turn-helix transcriptional regulator n=1 Tax=Apilactobacillus xinyiensis TaxID=2841032 RepID=UPI00200E30DB|nr:helix-turn-helix transcriptional regulator [Apilactobacillus xinyiensis]MCL0319405.1 helix-turn-helix transcriptional regulator [Apilactobacillus xinyiensis]